jgi:hypothetical protein
MSEHDNEHDANKPAGNETADQDRANGESGENEQQAERSPTGETDEKPENPRDQFAGMLGNFLNEIDALGDGYALSMAKSHVNQAMAWIERHLNPDPVSSIPDAPPTAPPPIS